MTDGRWRFPFRPVSLGAWGDQSYDIGPDGRFLMLRTAEGARLQVYVIRNWVTELRRMLQEAN